jgi:hypothetical protein
MRVAPLHSFTSLYCIVLANTSIDSSLAGGRSLREPANGDKALMVCPLALRLH